MQFNVLVVDDSAVMRGMIIRTLRMTGVPLGEVREAGDGQEALLVLRKEWMDLALVDINMPVMNGEELIGAVRADPELRDLAIIVVSTESSEARIESLRNLGVEFVHKPFTSEALQKTILGVTGVSHDQCSSVGTSPSGQLDF